MRPPRARIGRHCCDKIDEPAHPFLFGSPAQLRQQPPTTTSNHRQPPAAIRANQIGPPHSFQSLPLIEPRAAAAAAQLVLAICLARL